MLKKKRKAILKFWKMTVINTVPPVDGGKALCVTTESCCSCQRTRGSAAPLHLEPMLPLMTAWEETSSLKMQLETSWSGRWGSIPKALPEGSLGACIMFRTTGAYLRQASFKTVAAGLARPHRLSRLYQPRDAALVGGLHPGLSLQSSSGWSLDRE